MYTAGCTEYLEFSEWSLTKDLDTELSNLKKSWSMRREKARKRKGGNVNAPPDCVEKPSKTDQAEKMRLLRINCGQH
jgi:hypothetical protein